MFYNRVDLAQLDVHSWVGGVPEKNSGREDRDQAGHMCISLLVNWLESIQSASA